MTAKYGVKSGQVDNYIRRANKSFERATKSRAMDELNYVTIRFNKIYEEAMDAGRFKEANDALANLAKFVGLEPTKKTQTDLNVTDDKEIKARPSAELISIMEKCKEEGD